MKKPVEKKAMPCAAPVRSSATVSPIIFCKPDEQEPGRQRMQGLHAEEARNAEAERFDQRIGDPAHDRRHACNGKHSARRDGAEDAVEDEEDSDLGDHGPGPKQAYHRVAYADPLPVDRDETEEETVAGIDDAGACYEETGNSG